MASSLDRASQASLFDRFEWLELLHRHCMPEQAVDILHACEGDAQAWLCLADSGRRGRTAIANWYSFGVRPLFSGAPDEATRERLVATLTHRLAKRVSSVSLYPMTNDDEDLGIMTKALRSAGWITRVRAMGINSILDLESRNFDAYWSDRPTRLRKLVSRKGKQGTLAFTIHCDITDALWADYLHVYDKSWKSSEPYYSFLMALAKQEARAGTLRLGFARKNGVPVAAQLWTVENGVALIHKLAHDAAHDADSPGTLLSHHMFRAAIDQDRVSRIDYGTGNNAYKADWMERQRTLYRIEAYNPRFASAWPGAGRTWISRLVGRRFTR
ncbi:MAG: GNAT family N-acetyltransferase [Sphingobium sp.]|uniref:GNAT family N-acetyltransferase n=1 Tax=Sphingobium sp. TaxID=1912891 RepID=UPI0029B56B4F|nr:GNAT family N-acetyltransferase [Sphingobium sp.]MDX3908968.1 GNAT family N-acetyltransferase [Sphingobium sp.]